MKCRNDRPPGPELCEHCAAIEAGPHQHETKQRYRGCCNCAYFDGRSQLCRLRPPFQPVKPMDWCKEWAWICNSRHKWAGKLFAGEVHHPEQIHKPNLAAVSD